MWIHFMAKEIYLRLDLILIMGACAGLALIFNHELTELEFIRPGNHPDADDHTEQIIKEGRRSIWKF